MKRQIIAALVIGLIVAGIIIGLDVAGWLARPEAAIAGLFPKTGTHLTAGLAYGIVVLVAMAVAFLTLSASSHRRMLLIVAILLVELIVLAWVCSLYKLEFRPLPAMAAAVLS